MNKFHILIPLILLLAQACESDIDLDVPAGETKIVVEGHIENNQRAAVFLSRSQDFFGSLDSNDFDELIVSDARVFLRGNNQMEELNLSFDANEYPPLAYRSSSIIGEIDQKYSIEIWADGDTLLGQTHLSHPVSLDSVWYALEPGFDSLGIIHFKLSDPDTLGNRYRFFAKRLGRDPYFVPVEGDLREDQVVNGASFESFAYRGQSIEESQDGDQSERFYFRLGDTIVLKTSILDFNHFQFWVTLANNGSGNPFAPAGNALGNIENGLGVWGAYASTYDTLVAKVE